MSEHKSTCVQTKITNYLGSQGSTHKLWLKIEFELDPISLENEPFEQYLDLKTGRNERIWESIQFKYCIQFKNIYFTLSTHPLNRSFYSSWRTRIRSSEIENSLTYSHPLTRFKVFISNSISYHFMKFSTPAGTCQTRFPHWQGWKINIAFSGKPMDHLNNLYSSFIDVEPEKIFYKILLILAGLKTIISVFKISNVFRRKIFFDGIRRIFWNYHYSNVLLPWPLIILGPTSYHQEVTEVHLTP